MNQYHTLSAAQEAELKIHRSRFIAWVCPARDVNAARELVLERSRLFGDATHNCFAWITGFQREVQYYSDAGEPAGTAGKPILNALLSAGLTNVVAVVTRYYGGVKLGVRGLIDAYGDSVKAALDGSEQVAAIPTRIYEVSCDYPIAEQVTHIAKEMGGKVTDSEYGTQVRLVVDIPLRNEQEWTQTLDGLRAKNGLEYQQKREP